MRVKLQLVMSSDAGQEDTITDLVTLQKDAQRIEPLGVTLTAAQQLLTTIQQHLLHHQVEAFLDGCSTCPDCGTPLKGKGDHTRTFRTLFGTFTLSSPRLFHCRCRPRKAGVAAELCHSATAARVPRRPTVSFRTCGTC